MIKNILIAGLAVSNVATIAFLVLVLNRQAAETAPVVVNLPSEAFEAIEADRERVSIPAPEPEPSALPEEHTFTAVGHYSGNESPQIADRTLELTAVFDAQDMNGVIVAQGGAGHGFALYVKDGELVFALRRLMELTTVSGGPVGAGEHSARATLAADGQISLTLDANPPVTGMASGTITNQPQDGLDIGADRGAAVGEYEMPNQFGGTIVSVGLITTPLASP